MADSDHLRRIPLFFGLSETNLQLVAGIAHHEMFPRGSHLAEAGRPGVALYYILSGEAVVRAVRARGGRARPVGYLRGGASFGTTSLQLGEPHDATVIATTDVTALVINRTDFERLKAQAPDLEEQLVVPESVRAKLRYKRFPWLDPSEVVVYFARRHWFVFASAMFLPTVVVLALAALLLTLLRAMGPAALAITLGVVTIIYVPIVLWRLVDWRNDHFIVTTQRVVRRELAVLQFETRQEAPVARVQDVRIKRDTLGNLLGFGHVYIQTAAESRLGPITFDHVVDPEAARDAIMQQLGRAEVQLQSSAREAMRQELKRQLGWATAEELAAQRESRVTLGPAQAQPRRGWLTRLGAFLPPLRQEEGDRIVWRKHWLFLLLRIAKPLFAASIWLAVIITYLTGRLPFIPFPPPLGVVLGLFLSGFIVGFWLWWQTVDWENDVYILTDTVLIDVEKKPLFFAEERRETTLDRVQDVSMVVPNAFAGIMGYGNVNIQTAGAEGQFTFTRVPAPHDVQRTIMSRVARFRERRQRTEALQRRREMADWFTVYEELRRRREESGRSPSPSTTSGAAPG